MRITINDTRTIEANWAGHSSLADNLVIEFPASVSFLDIVTAFDGAETITLEHEDGVQVDDKHLAIQNITTQCVNPNTITLFLVPKA